MSCPKKYLVKLYSLYINRWLSEKYSSEVKAHLSECRECELVCRNLVFKSVFRKIKSKYSDVIMCIIEGYSYKETARILNIKARNVGSRFYRARMKFINCLKRYYPGWYNGLF